MVLKVGTVRRADQKYPESFEMWCWRRMQKISWTDRVRKEKQYIGSKTSGISYIPEGTLTGLVRSSKTRY